MCYVIAIIVGQYVCYICMACNVCTDIKFALRVCRKLKINYMNLVVTHIEIRLTCNARQTPHVLVFAVRAITPAVYLHCHLIDSAFDVRCDIKFCSYL